ncbi:MAG: PQQ-binding-like beta-propeller repeat protein [Bacteroidia bacterium]|nr:PQQ-binding-like beta-propeller repeat protein [Bacteroidia bacterium]
MKKLLLFYCFCMGCLLFDCKPGIAQNINWTHFRGSNLNGIALVESAPIKWANDSNLIWKTEIHGKGWSSPVVYDNQVWVTTATDDGKELSAVCLDFKNGKIIHDIKVFNPETVDRKHPINSYATPTPCIEKCFVYVHFGSSGTACINTTDGSILWTRSDLKCKHVQGAASSPILYGNLLILHYEGTDVRFIVALNKSNGEIVWRTERPKEPYEPLTEIGKKAYITPLVINVKGRDLLISNGSAVCIAYDPRTGKEVWRVVRGAESTVAMPVSENGIVFFYTGFMVSEDGNKFSELLAVNPDGKGDITKTNIIWKKQSEPIQLLTPVIKDGLIYTIDPKNILMCLNAGTGEEIWSLRLKENFNASPVLANGNIYFCSVKGKTLIIKEGRKLEVVAQNQLDGQIWAVPAILRNSILIRTDKYLCRIGR